MDKFRAWLARPVVRSAIRSLLFNVVVPLALYFAANKGAELARLGIDQDAAATISIVVGIMARAYFPNVVAPRAKAVRVIAH
jgi:hypothetical protein